MTLTTEKLLAALMAGNLPAILDALATMQTIVAQMLVECVDL